MNGAGGTPPPIANIAGPEAEEATAVDAATFRSPMAPDKTSNTKATTVRHLYISPPDGKLTRGDYMYFGSQKEQKSYILSKRSRTSDNVPPEGLDPIGGKTFCTVHE